MEYLCGIPQSSSSSLAIAQFAVLTSHFNILMHLRCLLSSSSSTFSSSFSRSFSPSSSWKVLVRVREEEGCDDEEDAVIERGRSWTSKIIMPIAHMVVQSNQFIFF
jgi:hypothetical protein